MNVQAAQVYVPGRDRISDRGCLRGGVDKQTVIASEAWRSLFINYLSSFSNSYTNNLTLMNRDCYVATAPRNDIITLSSISPEKMEVGNDSCLNK